ncbi:MAG: glycosyltransferase family 2 protein [Bacteriovoracales bacterium]|nr:glycosyltransferase family 2 protein [Bacteriovoracales bacterium]
MDLHWENTNIQNNQKIKNYCKNHVTAIFCTLNEEKTIGKLIYETKPYVYEIIVVDGHSSDQTREIAANCGARVFKDNRKGKGDAIKTGIGLVKSEVIVFIDADMSHNPNDIPKLISPIVSEGADHVIASRPRGGSDELHGDIEKFIRMIGSDIITLGINYRFGVRITDSQNGFRALRSNIARELNLKENITTIEQEMTIKTIKKGFKLIEVPVHEFKREHGGSRIKISRVAFRYVYSWLKYLFF